MAIESTTDLKEYCLRKLGKPVINIEIADVQCFDRIDEAIQKYIGRHYNGVTEVWEKYITTDKDTTKQFITLPSSWVSVNEIIEPGNSASNQLDSFNVQLAESDIFNPRSGVYLQGQSYVISMEHIETIKRLYNSSRIFTFNSASHILKVQARIEPGRMIFIHGYKAIDPETYVDVYNEEWIKKYSTALIKQQWGANIKKYDGVTLPGGVVMTGQKIYDEAIAEIEKLDEEFSSKWELPVDFYFE